MAVFTSAATIGAAVAGFFGATGAWAVGTTFATVAIGFATQAALGLALNALTPKPSSSASSRGYQVTQRGTALDHQVIYGRMRTAGVVVHDEVTDDNKYLHRVIAFAGHEVEEFEEFWINGEKVTINSSGLVTASPWNSKVKIRLRRGESDQLAEPDLVAASGAGWSNNHRLRGIAYLYVRLEFDPDVFPNGVPEIQATIKGKKVYDPRETSHDPDDESTWEWSDNSALCLSDYITSGYGLNEPRGNVDDGLVVTAANVCDEVVGSSKRYTCNGAFVTSVSPYNQLNDLLTSMGGLLWYAQGKWRMKPAYWVAPTLTFTEDDLRSSIAVQTRHSRRDNFNTVRGTFRGEESDWQVTDYPEYTNAAFVTADGGDESVADITLPFTDTAKEARRIARIALERNRQQLTVQASFGLRAFQVQVGDVINLSLERFGWDQKTFEVASWTFGLTDNQDLQVQMVLREISANVFDEVDDGIIYERDNTNLPSPFINVAPQNLVVSDGGFTTDDGTYVNSFIVDWDPPTDAFIDYYVLEWRKQGESVFKSVNLKTTDYQIAPVTDGITYDIRVKTINSLGVSGPYTTTTATVGGDNVAPAAPTAISATGGFRYITIDWDNPTDKDLSYVEVYENTSNSTSGASLVGEISGDQFVRTNLGINVTRWYFLKAVDYSGNKSSFTAGVSGTTTFLDDDDYENGIRSLFEDQGLYAIEDVATLPASGTLNRKVFNRADGILYEWDGSTWVKVIAEPDSFVASDKIFANTITGGLLATSGIITNTAQINNALITNAKIANLAVDTIKIADQAVSITSYYKPADQSTTSGSTTFIFDQTVNMPNAGSLAVVAMIQMFGTVDSTSRTEYDLQISGETQDARFATKEVAVAPATLSGKKDVSAGNHTISSAVYFENYAAGTKEARVRFLVIRTFK